MISSREKKEKKRSDFYKRLKTEGRYGYLTEPTWNKELHNHTCCKSKARWYHKIGCPAASGEFDVNKIKKPRLSKLNQQIIELRLKGKNSGEIAEILSLPLSEVNDVFSILH